MSAGNRAKQRYAEGEHMITRLCSNGAVYIVAWT
jgi:hypothetical protein